MKKFIKFLFIFLMSFTILVGCNDSGNLPSEIPSEIETIRIRFYVDDELYKTIKIGLDEEIKLPQDPVKEGCSFVGWYTSDGDKFNFEDVSENISLFAKFVDEDGKTVVSPGETEIPTLHEHDYGNEYKSNNNEHWQKCSCGETTIKEAHYGGTATETKRAECVVCGREYGDYKHVDTHVHYFDTFKSNNNEHWQQCSCGETTVKEAHYGGTATSTEKARCVICGRSYGNYKTEEPIPEVDSSFVLPKECQHSSCDYLFINFSYTCTSSQGYYHCRVCDTSVIDNLSFNCTLVTKESSEYYDVDNNYVVYEKLVCRNCGLIVSKNTVYTNNGGCGSYTYEIYSLYNKNGDVIVKNLSKLISQTPHNLTYSYSTSGNCFIDGVVVREECLTCSYVSEHLEYNHITEHIEASINTLCGTSSVYGDVCTVCGYYTDVMQNISCTMSHQGSNETTTEYGSTFIEWYKCETCGFETSYQTERVRTEDCHYITYSTIYYGYFGETYTFTMGGFSELHDINYSIEEYRGSCTEGYYLVKSCDNCSDYYIRDYISGHCSVYIEEKYDEFCYPIEVYYNGCLACNFENESYVSVSDPIGWNCVTSLEGYEKYQCANGCCEKEIHTSYEKINDCQYKKVYDHIYYHNGMYVFSAKTTSIDSNHDYIATVNMFGKTCDDGFDLILTCNSCGYKEEYYNHYGHLGISEADFYLELCGTLENYYITCYACGLNLGQWSNEIYMNWNQISGNDYPLHYICDNGCCEKVINREIIKGENCYDEFVYTNEYFHNGNLVATYVYSDFALNHQYQTSYELLGDTCDAGYRESYKCVYCGEGYSDIKYTHQTINHENDCYIEGYCGSSVHTSSCSICKELLSIDFYDNCSWIYYDDVTPYYMCQWCGALKWETVNTNVIDKCHLETIVNVHVEFNGEVAQDFTRTINEETHEYIYTRSMFGQTCMDGYEVYSSCINCDHSYTLTWYEHMITYTEIEHEELCGDIIFYKQKCYFCDYTIYQAIAENNVYFSGSDPDHLYCSNGCCERVITSGYESTDGCLANVTKTYSYYHNGVYIDYYSEEYTDYVHDLLVTYIIYGNGTNCTEGYEQMTECLNGCGYYTIITGKEHEIYDNYVASPGCGGYYIFNQCNICGSAVSYESTCCIFEESYNENGKCIETCTLCGIEKITTNYDLGSDGCISRSYTNIQLIYNGEIFYENNFYNRQENHNITATSPDFNGNCGDWHTIIETCIDCSEYYNEFGYMGHYYLHYEETIALNCGTIQFSENRCITCEDKNNTRLNEYDFEWIQLDAENDAVIHVCANGCCQRIETVECIYHDACNFTKISHISFYSNGQLAASFDIEVETAEHDIETYYEYLGLKCEDGVVVTECCSRCDYYNEYHFFGHPTLIESTEISYEGLCGFTFNHEYCQVCEEYSNWYFSNANCSIGWNRTEGDAEIMKCQYCDLLIRVTTLGEEEVNSCFIKRNQMIEIMYGENIINTFYASNVLQNHEFVYIVDPNVTDCSSEYIVLVQCNKCQHSYSYTASDHSTLPEHWEYIEEGFCGMQITVNKCIVCDRIVSYYYEYSFCDWEILEDTDTHRVEECSTCGARREITRYFHEQTDTCIIEYDVTITITYNGNTLVTFETTENYQEHNTETTYTLLGEDCLDGLYVLTKCVDCGASYSSTWYYHTVTTIIEYKDLDGYCGSEMHHESCDYCNYENDILYESCNWVFDGYVDAASHYTCSLCGAEKIALLEGYYDDNNNYINKMYVYITFKDEVLYNYSYEF